MNKRFGTKYFNWNIGGIEGASFFMKETLFLASSYAVDLDIDPTTKLQRKCFIKVLIIQCTPSLCRSNTTKGTAKEFLTKSLAACKFQLSQLQSIPIVIK